MRKKWKRIIKEAMNKDADRIMEEVNSDPGLKDVKAPEELHDKLFQQIREYEEEKEKEEQELIRLGKVYKKNKKKGKYLIILAAVIGVLAAGMTSMGGPKRMYEKVQRIVGGREQTRINTDDERMAAVEIVSEEDAYQQVEDEFGFFPARLYYRPEGLEFTEAIIEKETQNIRLYYEKGSEKVLNYTIWTNYRTVSTGADVEDTIVDEYTRTVQEVEVLVKKILVEENQEVRWRAEFQYQDIQYFIMMHGFTEEEMEETIKNLHFFK